MKQALTMLIAYIIGYISLCWTKHLKFILAMTVCAAVIMSLSGCANLDYGDLHWSRTGNWKGEAVIFTEYVTDTNGFSDVTIIIIGPDVNHDDMVGKAFEGAVRGLK